MLIKTTAFIAMLTLAPSALAAADLTTAFGVSPASSQVYQTARYTVTVHNGGNQNAANCSVQIALPATHTSPQVYVLGILGARSSNCSLSGTTLDCNLGTINKRKSKSVFFDIALPVSSEPFVFTATASTTSSESSTSNNGATRTASQTYAATPLDPAPGTPVTVVNSHCTGTGLTAWYECTRFPSAISSHSAELHDDGSITIPGEPAYSGQWTLTVTPNGHQLEFYYDDGSGVVAEFSGWGADGACFEGLTTFPQGGAYVAPYEVCPQ